MAGRNSLIAGNWKMNGDRAEAGEFLAKLGSFGSLARAGRELLICPPATLIALMAAPLAELDVAVGGQDCHTDSKGAFTGDVSASMLAELGCGYVIVGHSERRIGHGETDLTVRGKAMAALKAGLTPIICVGEIWADRESGQAERVVKAQIIGSVPDDLAAGSVVVAYEPVWAIGTGHTPTLDDIVTMHHVIGSGLTAKACGGLVLYGGSVKPGNAAEILTLDGVDGALIGGASLNAADFMAIADEVGA